MIPARRAQVKRPGRCGKTGGRPSVLITGMGVVQRRKISMSVEAATGAGAALCGMLHTDFRDFGKPLLGGRVDGPSAYAPNSLGADMPGEVRESRRAGKEGGR